MNVFVQKFFDILFPPSTETLVVRNITDAFLPTLLTPQVINGCIALCDFKNPTVRALIHEAKFHGNTRAQKLLGELIALYVSSDTQFQDAVFIPIPLSAQRMRERGYNQIHEILLRTQVIIPSVVIDQKLLIRTKNTRPQTEIPKEERIKNVLNAFSLKKTDLLAQQHIVLVDDVITTGATMLSAKMVLLKAAPRRITCLALAH